MGQISPELRSKTLRAVRSKHTGPELRVRRAAHRLGYRFRLHRKDLPGTPDLVFPRLRIALFVHGCFWHQHADCNLANWPKSNTQYWEPKLKRNIQRDQESQQRLEQMGWAVRVIWECETESNELLKVIHARLETGGLRNG